MLWNIRKIMTIDFSIIGAKVIPDPKNKKTYE